MYNVLFIYQKKGEQKMEYTYKCKKCNKEKIINCKLSEYQSTIKCECGEDMERIFKSINTNLGFKGSYNSER